LAESCFNPEGLLSANIEMNYTYRPDIELFGEAHSRIIVSLEEKDVPSLIQVINKIMHPIKYLEKLLIKHFK